jgi:hypothetical protein
MRITVEDLVRAAQSLPPQEVPTSDAAQ